MACSSSRDGQGMLAAGSVGRDAALPAALSLVLAVEDAVTAGSAPQPWSPLCPPTLQLQSPSCVPAAAVHSRQQPEK